MFKWDTYGNKSMTIFLAQKLVVGLSLKVFLCTGGFTLMQSDDVVFLPHFISVDGTESRGETAVCREEEDGCILDTVVWFAGKSGTQLTVDDARAAVGWRGISGGYGRGGEGERYSSSKFRDQRNSPRIRGSSHEGRWNHPLPLPIDQE
jgi:hypothetical protein